MIGRYKLALILSKLDEHPNPEYILEQYSITPAIAASVLWLARKDIKDKAVYDLGCGSGRFAIGAALLDAKRVYAVDIDPVVLEVARENANYAAMKSGKHANRNIEWIFSDISRLKTKADTVVQFPPFGNDKKFFSKALKLAKKVYSLHRASEKTKQELKKICRKSKAKISKIKKFKYHHSWKEEEKISNEIMLIVAKK